MALGRKIFLKFVFAFLAISVIGSCSPFSGKDGSAVTLASGATVYPNCLNDNFGSCVILSSTKNTLEPNLLAAHISYGISIFGTVGTNLGRNVLASNMYRDASTTQLLVYQESVLNFGVPFVNQAIGYRAIPNKTKDDEGLGGSVTFVDRTGWGSTTCGTSQATINARIADCAAVFGANATWDGAVKATAGQGVWKLVARIDDIATGGRGREVWRDERTGLLWSSLVSDLDNGQLTWCQASGNNNITGNPTAEADAQNYCDNALYQNVGTAPTNKAISACFEDGENFFTTLNPKIDNDGKAGLSLSSTPSVAWRLPNKYDYGQADVDGFPFIFPDNGHNNQGYEWTASSYTFDATKAWGFSSDDGTPTIMVRSDLYQARCVGR